MSVLKALRAESQQLDKQFTEAREQLLEAQQKQGTETAEEIEARYQEAEQYFQRLQREAAALLKVEAKFNDIRSQFKQDTDALLMQLFAATSRYRFVIVQN